MQKWLGLLDCASPCGELRHAFGLRGLGGIKASLASKTRYLVCCDTIMRQLHAAQTLQRNLGHLSSSVSPAQAKG